MAMKDDAYLVGHPEWEHIVIDAHRALGKPLPPALEQVHKAALLEKNGLVISLFLTSDKACFHPRNDVGYAHDRPRNSQ